MQEIFSISSKNVNKTGMTVLLVENAKMALKIASRAYVWRRKIAMSGDAGGAKDPKEEAYLGADLTKECPPSAGFWYGGNRTEEWPVVHGSDGLPAESLEQRAALEKRRGDGRSCWMAGSS